MKPVLHEEVRLLHEECAMMIQAFVADARASAGDFAKVERAAHVAIRRLRTALMSTGLEVSAVQSRRTYHCPSCGEALHAWSLGRRRVVTAEGEATYTRMRCRCVVCAQDHYPLEEANGLAGSQFTTGAKMVIAEAAADQPYAHASATLEESRGLCVSPKEVDRTVREVAGWRAQEERDLTGAVFGEQAALARTVDRDPLKEVAELHAFTGWRPDMAAVLSVDGALVRSPDQGPQGLEWFEVRGGLIAPAEEGSRAGRAYVGGVCTADALFDLLAATWRKGGHHRRLCLFVADGSRWIWERVRLYFPGVVRVLDIYHAGEHVASAAAAIWGEGDQRSVVWKRRAREMLLEPGGPKRIIRRLIAALRKPEQVADAKTLHTEMLYLFGHRHRMPYHALKAQGLPVGSGAMESGIKQLSTRRLRQPGMKWSRAGADAVLRVRAAHLSGSLRATTDRRHRALHAATQRYTPHAQPKAA